MKNLTDHVVICNWNQKSDELVRRLHTEFILDRKIDWHTIVVIAPNVSSFPDESSFGDTVLIPGDPVNPKLLHRARVDQARTVIILPDEKVTNPDDRTLRIALQLRSVIAEHQLKDKHSPSRFVRIVAKVVDSSNAAIFRKTEATGIHGVICEKDLGLRVMAQTSISPGLTYVLRDLLDYSGDSSELYLVPIPVEWAKERIKIESFHSIFERAKSLARRLGSDDGVIPLGFCREQENGDLGILINPTLKEVEAAKLEVFELDDQVLVMAYDRDSARAYLTGPIVSG